MTTQQRMQEWLNRDQSPPPEPAKKGWGSFWALVLGSLAVFLGLGSDSGWRGVGMAAVAWAACAIVVVVAGLLVGTTRRGA